MDDDLRTRLEIFRGMDTVPAGVIDFITDELTLLETGHRIDDASAGMLTSHLVMALSRMVRHEPDIDAPPPIVVGQVCAQAPDSVVLAREVSARAQAALGVPLSVIEQQYLSLHLATLATTAKEQKS